VRDRRIQVEALVERQSETLRRAPSTATVVRSRRQDNRTIAGSLSENFTTPSRSPTFPRYPCTHGGAGV
jgi:hypothetical protein